VIPTQYANCASCGTRLAYDYGRFDADAYDNGVLNKHFCPLPKLPAPMNEREWQAFIATEDARILLGLDPLRATKPVPPPAEREPVERPRPPKRKEEHVGGIQV
jgi:hypothetical protein